MKKDNPGKLPDHISIIMDGNGRWAKLRGKRRVEGHLAGVESVRACTEYAAEAGVKYLSLFAFSSENWNRPEDEVSALMFLMAKSMMDEMPTLMKNDIRFRVIGNRNSLSPELNSQIDALEKQTSNNKRMTLVIFLSYSGKWDILQAVGRYAAEHQADALSQCPSEEDFARYLSTAGIPDPDLLIRTSGEQRISNYLLWQCAYTEFYFTETLWPDFRKESLRSAIEEYSNRERRYGKTGEQINGQNKER